MRWICRWGRGRRGFRQAAKTTAGWSPPSNLSHSACSVPSEHRRTQKLGPRRQLVAGCGRSTDNRCTMALWQFDLFFVPTFCSAPTLEENGWGLPLFPERSVRTAHSLLSSRIGAPWTMCEDITVFGAETGNRVDVIPGVDGSAEISARIDARAESMQFCRVLHELASDLGCKFFSPEFKSQVETEVETLVEALMRSRAWSYALNPVETLRRIAGGN